MIFENFILVFSLYSDYFIWYRISLFIRRFRIIHLYKMSIPQETLMAIEASLNKALTSDASLALMERALASRGEAIVAQVEEKLNAFKTDLIAVAETQAAVHEEPSDDGASDSDHAATPSNTAAKRALFAHATPNSKFRPDLYKETVRNPRRVTMSTASGAGRQSTSHAAISNPLPKIDIPKVEVFTGIPHASSSRPADSVPVRLNNFIRELEGYLSYVYGRAGHMPTEEEYLEQCVLFLASDARKFVEDLQTIAKEEEDQDGMAHELTWETVKEAMVEHFGKPVSGMQLITDMIEMRQAANETVADFATRFDVSHMELTRQGLAGRDLSSALFVRALVPHVRDKVRETVSGSDYFVKEEIGARQPRKAISKLLRLAVAKESSFNGSRSTVTSSAPSQGQQRAQAAPGASKSSNGNNNSDNASRPRIPDDLYAARIKANLCFKCGASGHVGHRCRSPINFKPVVTKPSGGRFHAMSVNDDDDEEEAEERAPTVSASGKA